MPLISNIAGTYTEDQVHEHDIAYLKNRVSVSISESMTAINSTTNYGVSRDLLESFTIDDAVVYLRRVPVLIGESLELDAIAARLAKVSRAISESFTITDDAFGHILEEFAVSVSDSLTIISSAVRKVCRILPFLHS